jgi:hypothetical protein
MIRKSVWTLFAMVLCAACFVAAREKANVTIVEWATPTPNSHPHDPLATADGRLWYTAQTFSATLWSPGMARICSLLPVVSTRSVSSKPGSDSGRGALKLQMQFS